MPRLEKHLHQRWPHWFRGRRARLARPLLRGIGRWSRFDLIEDFLATHGHLRGFEFVAAARDFLQLRYEVDPEELQRIPARGRLLVVANHPSGALDALALLDCIGGVDPAFSDSIDGLVEGDLHRIRPQKARRWLHREGEQA